MHRKWQQECTKKTAEYLTPPFKYELHRSTKTGEYMNAFLSKFMMYYEIKRMNRDGRSISKISEALNFNRRTVKKYLEMEDQEFESFLKTQNIRPKLLLRYEALYQSGAELRTITFY